MNEQLIIEKTVEFVKEKLKNAEGGHDWWHVERVWKLSKKIAAHENVNLFVVELAALLHDIADSKFYEGNETIGIEIAETFLYSLKVKTEIIEHVSKIIQNISFKGGNFKQNFSSPELNVVQDADRIDALGAIGIARTFNYGGFKNREIYNPTIKPNMHMSKQEYKTDKGPTINHFYEKLLRLKDRMNTPTGLAFAERRHKFMELFLEQFYEEWKGNA